VKYRSAARAPSLARVQAPTSSACFYSDRLGTVRAVNSVPRNHYPFGEEIGTPSANNTYKFVSTFRDSNRGLDYAVARYYLTSIGRYLAAGAGGSTATGAAS